VDLLWPTAAALSVERGCDRCGIERGASRLRPLRSRTACSVPSAGLVAGDGVFRGVAPAAVCVGGSAAGRQSLGARPPGAPGRLAAAACGWSELGLGLWDSPGVAQVLEVALFLACFAVYLRTPAGKGAGFKPWVLAAVLLAIQIAKCSPATAAFNGSNRVGRASAMAARRGRLLGGSTTRGRRGLQAGAAVGGRPFGAGR